MMVCHSRERGIASGVASRVRHFPMAPCPDFLYKITTIKKLEDEALRLPARSHAQLAERLLVSLDEVLGGNVAMVNHNSCSGGRAAAWMRDPRTFR
jgi:hypothetical protein